MLSGYKIKGMRVAFQNRRRHANLVAVIYPCGLLNSKLARRAIGLAHIPTCIQVVKAGRVVNRSIGWPTGFVAGVGRNRPLSHVMALEDATSMLKKLEEQYKVRGLARLPEVAKSEKKQSNEVANSPF